MTAAALVLSAIAMSGPPAVQAAPARTSLVYERGLAPLRVLTGRPDARAAEPGRMIVEPSADTVYGAARHSRRRVAKVSARDLAGLTALGIASTLRQAIVGGCVREGRDFGCESHMVVVDEIDARFADGRVPGRSLAAAMGILDVASPYGGTYAGHVHFYVAPGVVTSIGAGRGPNQNLGRDGKPHFRTWRAAMGGLVRGGGIWLEMYHGQRLGDGYQPFSAGEWRRYPADVLRLFRARGGDPGRVHFVMSNTPVVPGGARECGGLTPMGCVWRLAARPGANASIIGNGVGTYQVGAQAAEWLAADGQALARVDQRS
jgi:hypothetical protein